MKEEHHPREKEPRFERGLHPLIGDPAGPSASSDLEDELLSRWLQHPLLVLSTEGRGTLLLPVWRGEGGLSSRAAFLNGEGEPAVGPVLIAADEEELVRVALAHYQLSPQQADVPVDRRMGAYCGVRYFRLATWPEPLYLCGQHGRARDLIAMMPLQASTSANRRAARVVRWNLDGERTVWEEELSGDSPDQVFRRLLLRYRRARLALFWMARVAMWTLKVLASLPIIGIQVLLAAFVWFLRSGAESPVVSFMLTGAAVLIGLGGSLLLLQPVLFPRLLVAQTRRARLLRILLLGVQLLLELAALAYVTGAQSPPLVAGLTFSTALSAWFPTILAVNALEWGIGIIFWDDIQAESRARPAPARP